MIEEISLGPNFWSRAVTASCNLVNLELINAKHIFCVFGIFVLKS